MHLAFITDHIVEWPGRRVVAATTQVQLMVWSCGWPGALAPGPHAKSSSLRLKDGQSCGPAWGYCPRSSPEGPSKEFMPLTFISDHIV